MDTEDVRGAMEGDGGGRGTEMEGEWLVVHGGRIMLQCLHVFCHSSSLFTRHQNKRDVGFV